MYAMDKLGQYFRAAYEYISSLPFERLMLISLCSAGGVFALATVLCIFSSRVRRADKKPLLYLLNAFTAAMVALFSMGFETNAALFFSALFWLAGYLVYGLLTLFTRSKPVVTPARVNAVSSLPVRPAQREEECLVLPAAKSTVRLEHALSIADKLLLCQLTRTDRQEVEKIKTTLTVLQVKGNLSPQEGEILNENFNAILKFMAKYHI